nr:two-component sensor histidine kinase [Lachnospiraceae bacterium]
MKKKINLRLSLTALVAIVATTVGITLVSYNLFQKQVRDDLKLNALLLVETEIFQKAYASENENAEILKNLNPGYLRITWIDGDGTVLFDNDTDISGLTNHMDRPEIIEAFEKGEGESTRRSDTMNMNTFYYALLLENGTVLRLSMQARNIGNVLFNALPVIGGIVVVILLVCVLIGHLLTGQLMKPLEIMAEDLDAGTVPVYKELEPFADKIRAQHENILAA